MTDPMPDEFVATGVSAAPSGPRIPRREAWIDLPEEYAGFRVKVWVNYPRRLNDELRSGDAARINAALQTVVLEHNGWCAEDGAALPAANTAAFWEAIPDELASAVVTLLMEQVGKLAGSIRARITR